VTSLEEAELAATEVGYPVVLKSATRGAMAKTAGSGLAIDLADQASLRAAWRRMEEGLGEPLRAALVQPMVVRGVDVAVSVHDHPEVGPVLALGPGGASAALDQAVDVRVLPLTELDAQRMVAGSRLGPVLDDGARRALEDLLLRIGALIEEVPEIVGLRANPVLVSADGAILTDVALAVAPLDHEPLPPLRRL
jgi:acyl-CoA synthetase (NDP forming)